MPRLLVGVFALMLAWAAGSFRLYLKDGTYHAVREYQKSGDRIRYYSVERSDWEEIPAELVDFDKTESERAAREEAVAANKEANRAEAEAERAIRREINSVPAEPGVYHVLDGVITPVKQAETRIVTAKKRAILKAITPIPLIAGKSTVELDGEAAAFAVKEDRPEFYFRLAREERFTMIKLTPRKGVRVVGIWNVVPVSNELIEEYTVVDVFRQQVGESLYKIWPKQPLGPGEYAVIEYTEGKGNTSVWDFRAAGGGAR